MIILTDKKLVIPVGIAPNYAGAGNSDIKLQSKSVTITENGSKTLFPDGNYDGFSQVNIKTNVASVNPVLEDKSVEISENGDYRFTPGPAYDGIGNFRIKVNVETYDPIPVESVKTAYPSFEQDVTVVPSDGYEAMSSVIVKKAEPNLQDKNVDKASTSEIVLRADECYQGLGTVTVAPIKTKTVSADPSTNVQEFSANTEDNEYITSVTVNPVNARSINVDPSTNYQEFSANTENNEYITSVTVNRIGTKTVTADPSTNVQEFSANTENNEYITSVTVNPVGTKTVTLDSSINVQTVNANVEGNEYITSVTVNPVKTKSLSITPRLVEQTFTAEQQLYKTVNVSAIKHTEKTYDASTNTQTYDYAENNDVFIKNLTINPVTSSIDPNIVPGNIAKGVSILGVTGTLEGGAGNVNGLSNGPALTIKFKVKEIFSSKSTSSSTVYAAGKSGYIYLFSILSDETLADKGIIAYAVNGELHTITDPNDSYIPYTKKTSDYDDVVVDVYIDFEQSGRYCASKEGVDYETSPYYGSSYNYLPNTIDYYSKYFFNYCTEDKTIVRSTVNAIGKGAFIGGSSAMLIFEPGVDGIKRFANDSIKYIQKFDIYIYGNIAEFPSFFNTMGPVSSLFKDSYAKIYGDIENYPDKYLTNVNLLSTKLYGIIKTVSNTPLKLYKVTGKDITDYYEGCTKDSWSTNNSNRIIIPASCTSIHINTRSSNSGKYIYLSGNKEIVFFGTTPPSLLNEGTPQQPISTNDPSTNDSKIERVFIPAGSNYDSILREPPFRPEVIEFTPITDLSTINRAGYYGYTLSDGSHALLNVATTSQAESDIETIATEINNL